MSTVERLEQFKRDVVAGIDDAIVTFKGSVEFRNAVEALLVGTPYEKPADDHEGLYGRVRSALSAVQQEHAEAARLRTAMETVIDAYGDQGWAKSDMCRYLRKVLASHPLPTPEEP